VRGALSAIRNMARNCRIISFIVALALTIVGALGAIYVLFFAAGGYFITAVASAIFLGVGLIWLSDLVDAPSP
jgi:hypothetical protein